MEDQYLKTTPNYIFPNLFLYTNRYVNIQIYYFSQITFLWELPIYKYVVWSFERLGGVGVGGWRRV